MFYRTDVPRKEAIPTRYQVLLQGVLVLLLSLSVVGCGLEDNEPTPTSDDAASEYEGLTFDEAQELTSFELIRPDPVPEQLELSEVAVSMPTEGRPGETAYLFYRLVDADMPKGPIEFEQTTLRGVVDHRNAVETTIGSRQVTTFTVEDRGGAPLAIYAWLEDDAAYMVSAPLSGGVSEDLLEDFIAALPA